MYDVGAEPPLPCSCIHTSVQCVIPMAEEAAAVHSSSREIRSRVSGDRARDVRVCTACDGFTEYVYGQCDV